MVLPVFSVPGLEHVTDQPEKPVIADLLRQYPEKDIVAEAAEGLPALLRASMTSRQRCEHRRKAFSPRRQRLSCCSATARGFTVRISWK